MRWELSSLVGSMKTYLSIFTAALAFCCQPVTRAQSAQDGASAPITDKELADKAVENNPCRENDSKRTGMFPEYIDRLRSIKSVRIKVEEVPEPFSKVIDSTPQVFTLPGKTGEQTAAYAGSGAAEARLRSFEQSSESFERARAQLREQLIEEL
jgi:hypothetical protein